MMRQKRGSPTITARQRALFLQAFEKTGNVARSAAFAGFDRSTAYAMQDRFPEWKAAWDEIGEGKVDELETVAWDMATVGDGDYIVTKDGGIVMDPENPEKPLRNMKRDSRMIMYLLNNLRAHKYKNTNKTETNINLIPAELQPDPKPEPDEPGPDKPIL